MANKPLSAQALIRLAAVTFLLPVGATLILAMLEYFSWADVADSAPAEAPLTATPGSSNFPQAQSSESAIATFALGLNGRPQLSPLPPAEQVWECEVVVVGGSLGGVAAASQAMRSGAQTCLIELTPWLGGQISSQGVSAIDESVSMRQLGNFSQSWKDFKALIESQPAFLPSWSPLYPSTKVADVNRCWVGNLCFPPKAGATTSEQWLQAAAKSAPGSRWGTAIAFKGAEFDISGRTITAIHAVRRIPRSSTYMPLGRLSKELPLWYAWSSEQTFKKIPLRLQAPAGKQLVVIDATDTGEVVGWAGIPHRLGSDAQTVTTEPNAAKRDNPECTQAFTFPFVVGIHNDAATSWASLTQVQSNYNLVEHLREFTLDGFPMFHGNSFFHYRRIVSTTQNDPIHGSPAYGDMTLVNWTQGNDWNWMNPALILTAQQLAETGQYQNWMGGISSIALGHAEEHALLFSRWLIETQASPEFPLAHLAGIDSPMNTLSGLSMVPYIREGRRILGRSAYGQPAFMMLEQDIRRDQTNGRDFSSTSVGVTHYAVDIHGCRYRNWEQPWEAQGAPTYEPNVRPIVIPLESLIPQGVDNLLVGGKGIAVSHIVNAATRVHYGEWSIGGAAGATAGWLTTQTPELTPASVSNDRMAELQQHLIDQGLELTW